MLERAQPLGLHLPPAHGGRRVLRRAHLPQVPQGVLGRREARRPRRARRRRLDRPRRLRRSVPHEPAALRPLPQGRRRRGVLRRLLTPPVHARGQRQQGPRPASERPDLDRDPLQPEDAAAPLPRQALLPDRVRLQHEPLVRLRWHGGEQGRAGDLPAQGLRLRRPLPSGEEPLLVSRQGCPRRRHACDRRRLHRPARDRRQAQAQLVRVRGGEPLDDRRAGVRAPFLARARERHALERRPRRPARQDPGAAGPQGGHQSVAQPQDHAHGRPRRLSLLGELRVDPRLPRRVARRHDQRAAPRQGVLSLSRRAGAASGAPGSARTLCRR